MRACVGVCEILCDRVDERVGEREVSAKECV